MLGVQDRPFRLYVSASPHTLAALLAQHDDDGKDREVYYISRILVDYETCYCAMEKQCLGIIFTMQKLRHYLLHVETHVIVKCDHLIHLFSRTDLSGRLAKWVMLLSEFDLKFVSQKAIKGQALANQLAEALSPYSFPNLDML